MKSQNCPASLSYSVLPCPTPSCLVLLRLPCPIPSCLVLFRPPLSYSVLPCLVLPCHTLPCPTLCSEMREPVAKTKRKLPPVFHHVKSAIEPSLGTRFVLEPPCPLSLRNDRICCFPFSLALSTNISFHITITVAPPSFSISPSQNFRTNSK